MIVADRQNFTARASRLWGSDSARRATEPDSVGGVAPLVVLEPADRPMLAAMLQWAERERIALVPRGAGTKLSWGPPPSRLDAVLSTARLDAPVDHCAGDLTATIPAGCTLSSANALLARERQWLPLDPPYADRATIGGIVAANDSGPRRHRYGAPRDLIIGVEMTLADGRAAKAGGRVVKNVAGYDVGRLLCGSWGTLAVITAVTFKLAPIASQSRTVVATAPGFDVVGELLLALAASTLAPTAVEIESSPIRLLVRFETTPAAVRAQAASAAQLSERHGARVDILDGAAEEILWADHNHRLWASRAEAEDGLHHDTIVKASVLPSKIGGLLERAASYLAEPHLVWWAAGRAAGVIFFRFAGPAVDLVGPTESLQRVARELGGTAVVLHTAADARSRLTGVDDPGHLAALMSSIKAQFDPHDIFSPGRGPRAL